MSILKGNANLFKWLCLILAILSFAGRLIYGELYESTAIRPTGEERLEGSIVGYLLMGSTIVFILGFILFGQLKKGS